MQTRIGSAVLGVTSRMLSGMVVGAILGALVGVIVGCRFANGSELGYSQTIIVAWVVVGGWLGAGTGFIVVVIRSIEKKSGKSNQGSKDQMDKLST